MSCRRALEIGLLEKRGLILELQVACFA